MKKVFIVHGFGGIPNGGWFPWLMKELAKKGVPVCSLLMPHTNDPVVSEWVDHISSNVVGEEENAILLGHSLGVPAILRYLESLPEGRRIGGVVLVSGFIEPLDTEDPNSAFRKIDAFAVPEINFEKIKDIPKSAVILHGSEDKLVPFSHAERIAKGLNCKLVRIEGGTHFSQITEPICYELPEVLEAVLEIANS